jgi:hypothetical protein
LVGMCTHSSALRWSFWPWLLAWCACRRRRCVGEHTHNLSGHTASHHRLCRIHKFAQAPHNTARRSMCQRRGMGMNKVPLTTKDMAAAPLTTAAPTAARHTTAGPASAPIDVGRSFVQGSGTLCWQTSPLPQITETNQPQPSQLTAHTTRKCLRCAPRNRGHNVSRENVSADHRANTRVVASWHQASQVGPCVGAPPPSLFLEFE